MRIHTKTLFLENLNDELQEFFGSNGWLHINFTIVAVERYPARDKVGYSNVFCEATDVELDSIQKHIPDVADDEYDLSLIPQGLKDELAQYCLELARDNQEWVNEAFDEISDRYYEGRMESYRESIPDPDSDN
jgi:hypothetical protein